MNDTMHKIMDELDRTEELLHKGLREINDKGDLNVNNLEILGETLDGIKDLCEIKGKGIQMIEEYGYSQRGNSYGWNDPNYPHSQRYSRNDRPQTTGHSWGNDPYLDDLHRRMDSASSDAEREIIRKMIVEREGR